MGRKSDSSPVCALCGHGVFVTAPEAEAIACAACGFVCTRHQAALVGEYLASAADGWFDPRAAEDGTHRRRSGLRR